MSSEKPPKDKIRLESGRELFGPKGLFMDAFNIWAAINISLGTLRLKKTKGDKNTDDILRDLNTPRKTYETYLRQLYSSEDAQRLIKMSDPATIIEHDVIVAEYNNLVSLQEVTEESAQAILEKAKHIFYG